MDQYRLPLLVSPGYMHVVSCGKVNRIDSHRLHRQDLEFLDNPWDIDRRPYRLLLHSQCYTVPCRGSWHMGLECKLCSVVKHTLLLSEEDKDVKTMKN